MTYALWNSAYQCPYKTIGSVNWQQGLAIFEHTLSDHVLQTLSQGISIE